VLHYAVTGTCRNLYAQLQGDRKLWHQTSWCSWCSRASGGVLTSLAKCLPALRTLRLSGDDFFFSDGCVAQLPELCATCYLGSPEPTATRDRMRLLSQTHIDIYICPKTFMVGWVGARACTCDKPRQRTEATAPRPSRYARSHPTRARPLGPHATYCRPCSCTTYSVLYALWMHAGGVQRIGSSVQRTEGKRWCSRMNVPLRRNQRYCALGRSVEGGSMLKARSAPYPRLYYEQLVMHSV